MMKKFLMILGVLLMAVSLPVVCLMLLNAPKMLADANYTRGQNIASFCAITGVYLLFLYLGYRLFRAGRRAAPAKRRAPPPDPRQKNSPSAEDLSPIPEETFESAAQAAPVPEETSAPTEQAAPVRGEKTELAEQAAAAAKAKEAVPLPTEELDDPSFIRDMHHTVSGAWQQYDILLDALGYGWDTMLSWADALIHTDLHVETVTVGDMGMGEREFIAQVRQNGGSLTATPELAEERGILGVGGFSETLRMPVKLVWFNQTRVFRIFALVDDDALMTRYAETAIRRSFGTPDAMKLAKPQKKQT